DHVDVCEKKPVECPNSCGAIIVREEIQRKDVESHLQSTMRIHLDLACTTFKETTGKLEETSYRAPAEASGT
ncbi:hypothetical protein OS493_025038, partial [Desmophyllum pertusum]